VLGSGGGEGHRKQLRAIAKEAEKRAREAAAAAKEARFFQPEPLSPEFQFVVRMRDRCVTGAALALRFEAKRAQMRPSAEVRKSRVGVITLRQLRLMGSSGLLLIVLLKLSRHCRSKVAAKISSTICSNILARVSARQATPEVLRHCICRLSLLDPRSLARLP
jgi:hypothetical protein